MQTIYIRWQESVKEHLINTLLTVPKTPEPRGLIFLKSEGLNMRAWTLVPFSPGPSGSKLCQLYISQIKRKAGVTLEAGFVQGLTSPLSRYLLMALLRRMARPRWYSMPRKNNTKQKIKPAGTPKAIPVIWPLQRQILASHLEKHTEIWQNSF